MNYERCPMSEYITFDGPVLFKNGKTWNSKNGSFKDSDFVVTDGKITDMGKIDKGGKFKETYDLTGCFVFPGFFDMHVHLRDPGYEDKETVESGAKAAAAGGFTGIACMPNTHPICDNQEIVKHIIAKNKFSPTRVYPIGAATQKSEGKDLAEIGDMVDAGIVAVSDDGRPVFDSAVTRKVLEYIKMFNIPLISHAEELSLAAGGCMNEGFVSTRVGLNGIPNIAEDIITMRDIMIAEYVHGRVHFAHVSTKGAVDLIRQAKDKGICVTAEVTPHHLTLTDEIIATYNPNYKMNPPLRTAEDVEALYKGLKDGTIDVIATDHAPHTIEDKEFEYDKAPFGVTGLETAFGVLHTEYVLKDKLNYKELVQKLVVNPRKVLNIPIPEVASGKEAEFTVVNPVKEWVVDKSKFYSQSINTCYPEKELTGDVWGVMNRGMLFVT